ncbi:hypothetical protein [Xanthobacter autotrophicus]|uniref:hypothetical protein n=1 Tax=Xanthobacter autotrophicus TaxID=280 RepID=UPI00372AC745
MMDKTDEQRLSNLETELRGRILALEVLLVAIAQRVPGADKSLGAALHMLDGLRHAPQQPVDETAAARNAAIRIAIERLEAVGEEVIAFKAGDGIETI